MRPRATLAATSLLLAGCLGPGAPTRPAVPLPSAIEGEPTEPPQPLRYVALGDAYPIGDGLSRQVDRWPNQLVRGLRPLPLTLVENLAGQSDGTFDVIEEQLPVLEELSPDLVTLQVGANDLVVSRLDEAEYRANLVTILDGRGGPPATARKGILELVPPECVVLVTTPDHTLWPGQRFEREGDAERLDRYNAILEEVATERGVQVVDIAPIADLVPRDRTLLTDDGEHPSEKQYAGWVELIAPTVQQLVAGTEAGQRCSGDSGPGMG